MASKPTVTVYDEPHWSAVVTFPNGAQVMVCDASADEEVFENVVVTAVQTTEERILLRAITVRPGDVADPTLVEIVGPEARLAAATAAVQRAEAGGL